MLYFKDSNLYLHDTLRGKYISLVPDDIYGINDKTMISGLNSIVVYTQKGNLYLYPKLSDSTFDEIWDTVWYFSNSNNNI